MILKFTIFGGCSQLAEANNRRSKIRCDKDLRRGFAVAIAQKVGLSDEAIFCAEWKGNLANKWLPRSESFLPISRTFDRFVSECVITNDPFVKNA